MSGAAEQGIRSKVIRDAVTGEKLTDEHGHWLPTAGRYFIRVKPDLHDDATPPDLADDLDLPPLPSAVDSSQVYPLGRLGGRAWTPGWKKRIGKQATAAVQAERDAADAEYRAWWRTDYAKARVLEAFTRRYGAHDGAIAAHAALKVLDRPDDFAAIAAEAGRSYGWLDRMRSLAFRYGLGHLPPLGKMQAAREYRAD